jgi:hypothetical protein
MTIRPERLSRYEGSKRIVWLLRDAANEDTLAAAGRSTDRPLPHSQCHSEALLTVSIWPKKRLEKIWQRQAQGERVLDRKSEKPPPPPPPSPHHPHGGSYPAGAGCLCQRFLEGPCPSRALKARLHGSMRGQLSVGIHFLGDAMGGPCRICLCQMPLEAFVAPTVAPGARYASGWLRQRYLGGPCGAPLASPRGSTRSSYSVGFASAKAPVYLWTPPVHKIADAKQTTEFLRTESIVPTQPHRAHEPTPGHRAPGVV